MNDVIGIAVDGVDARVMQLGKSPICTGDYHVVPFTGVKPMRKILEVHLDVDTAARLQRTEIIREHANGERTLEIMIERPLELEDRGHEMILAR